MVLQCHLVWGLLVQAASIWHRGIFKDAACKKKWGNTVILNSFGTKGEICRVV